MVMVPHGVRGGGGGGGAACVNITGFVILLDL